MPKRCACLHDLAGLGHCSLTAAMPILSVMGAQCCPAPTAVLSSQTDGYTGYSFLDFTDALGPYIRHWKHVRAEFDAIYTGFLGSAAQIGLVTDFIAHFRGKNTLVLVDPVMGDAGAAYDTYTAAMCEGMRRLARRADLITPNLTEAAILLSEPFSSAPKSREGLTDWALRLSGLGPARVVITGVPAGGSLCVVCCDRGAVEILEHPLMGRETASGGAYPGTGDVFASVLLGALLREERLSAAAWQAAQFVAACVAHTDALGTPPREGLYFESLLGRLA